MQQPPAPAIVRYQDITYLCAYNETPLSEPMLLPDVAPIPVWLVPPVWRLARLTDLMRLAGKQVKPEIKEVCALLTLLDIRWVSPVHTTKWQTPLLLWQVKRTKEHLVLWRLGKLS